MSTVYEIPGISNWDLRIEKRNGETAIYSASTGDRKAVLPDEIEGCPVTALKDRALAPGVTCSKGEDVRITYGMRQEEPDNGKLEVLTLPRELRTLGSYALMNCRSLKEIRLFDKIGYIGVSPFMNCHELKDVHFMKTGEGSYEALYFILSSMPNEFDLTLTEEDGSEARFVIPEYYELLEENEPTHFFNMTIEGGGYPYHAVFGRNGFSINDYDELFPAYIKGYYEKKVTLRMAYNRLRQPYGLSNAAEKRYMEFLMGIAEDALKFAVDLRDIQGLQMIVSAKPGGEALKNALIYARENGYTEAVAVLLEATRGRASNISRHRYEF